MLSHPQSLYTLTHSHKRTELHVFFCKASISSLSSRSSCFLACSVPPPQKLSLDLCDMYLTITVLRSLRPQDIYRTTQIAHQAFPRPPDFPALLATLLATSCAGSLPSRMVPARCIRTASPLFAQWPSRRARSPGSKCGAPPPALLILYGRTGRYSCPGAGRGASRRTRSVLVAGSALGRSVYSASCRSRSVDKPGAFYTHTRPRTCPHKHSSLISASFPTGPDRALRPGPRTCRTKLGNSCSRRP